MDRTCCCCKVVVTLSIWITARFDIFMLTRFANLWNTCNMDCVHGCGVISDGDVDFGRVLQPANDVCVIASPVSV